LILDDEAAISVYTDFRVAYSQLVDPAVPASYPDYDGGTFDIGGMAFSMMAREHAVTIANTVNAFMMYLRQIKGWARVLDQLDEDASRPVLIDFVNPLVYFCLDSPYRIKQRICSSTAQLSHQANRGKVEGWTDSISLTSPKFGDARRHAQHWDEWAVLENGLADLDSPGFREALDDFRNEFHHGFPRRVATGHTSFVERRPTPTGVSYAFGSKPPLALHEVIASLESQYSAALVCYEAYIELVSAQRASLLLNDG